MVDMGSDLKELVVWMVDLLSEDWDKLVGIVENLLVWKVDPRLEYWEELVDTVENLVLIAFVMWE